MDTGVTARAVEPGYGAVATSRIVRTAHAVWPTLAAAVVVTTVWAAMPHGAWLPFGDVPPDALLTRGDAFADAWQAPLAWPTNYLAALQVRLGALVWPHDHVGGAIGVAATLAAASVAVQAIALRATGLTAPLSALLALVSIAGPLLARQSGSPLGAGPVTLVSALLLWRLVRQRVRVHVTWFGALATTAFVAVGIGVLAGLSAALGRWLHSPPAATTLAMLRHDLGLAGLVLLFPALGRRDSALVPRERVWLGAAVLWLATTPMAPAVRAAVLLPWLWWLAGAGLAQVLAWRGPHASRWAAAGLLAWMAIHVAKVPWGHQRQAAALTRTWADGVIAGIDLADPWLREDSARGRLISGLLASPISSTGHAPIVDVAHARAAIEAGRRPLAVGQSGAESLRWGGVALAAADEDAGASIQRILDGLPQGTVVLAAVSRDAASRMSPAQWQSLGRIGLRLADAGTARAHVVAGVTRARIEALELARAGSVRLDVQPGDPLGRTGTRSPTDARLEADDRSVRVHVHGRPLLDRDGLALVFFSTRGDLLAWRAGVTADHLDGPSLGSGPRVHSIGAQVLPCVEVMPGRQTDVTSLTSTHALGIAWQSPGHLDLHVTRPAGAADRISLAAEATDPTAPQLQPGGSGRYRITPRVPRRPAGLYLPGSIAGAHVVSTAPARVCAALPLPHLLDTSDRRIELPVLPRYEALFGDGWHPIERLAGGGFFRWMADRRATIRLPLRTNASVRLSLDAQGLASSTPDDRVNLIVNGHPGRPQSFHQTRGLYGWEVPSAWLTSGVNTLMLETSRTVRPADLTPGADPRRLGLAVFGWYVDPVDSTPADVTDRTSVRPSLPPTRK